VKFKKIPILPLAIVAITAVSVIWNVSKNWDDFTTPTCTFVSPIEPQKPLEFVPDSRELQFLSSSQIQNIYSAIESADSPKDLESKLFYSYSEAFEEYNNSRPESSYMLLAPEFLSDNPKSIQITSKGCKTNLLEGIGLTPIKNNDMPQLKKFAKIFVEETSKYPLSWWDKAVPPFVVFVKAVRVNGEIVGGVEQGAVVFNITQADNIEAARETIHHELMHWLEHSTRSRTGPTWPGIPDSYFGEYNLDSDFNSEFHPEAGFITGYAKTNSAEDKAEIYSLMFSGESYELLSNLAKSDPVLNKKIDYIKNFISSRVTQMDEKYFGNIED
jgi:hypothetical protein